VFTSTKKYEKDAKHQWLTRVILAIQEAEIRRITVQSQPGQIVLQTLSQKYPVVHLAEAPA
jgi:mannosyltransferase OCH1-like enzyme